MKFNCFLLFSLFLCGCNNWNENPVKITGEEEKEITYSFINSKLNYPQKTSKIFPLDSNTIIAATSEGKIFKSTDDGFSWSMKGLTENNSSANCFYRIDNTESLLMGTTGGIYYTEDNGDSWKKSKMPDETGNNINIVCIDRGDIPDHLSDTIYAYGWDGKNNSFESYDKGKNWSKFSAKKFTNCEITAKVRFDYILSSTIKNWILQDHIRYGGCSNSISVWSQGMNSMPESLAFGSRITCFYFFNNNLFIGTDRGMLSGLYSSSLVKNNFDEVEVKSFASFENLLMAATKNGVHYSSDNGVSWNLLNYSYESESAESVLLWKGNLIVNKSNGDVIRAPIAGIKFLPIYNPIVIYPKDQSIGLKDSIAVKFLDQNGKKAYQMTVQISSGNDFSSGNTKTYDNLKTDNVILTGLEKNKTYYWRYCCYNLFYKNEWSEIHSFTTDK